MIRTPPDAGPRSEALAQALADALAAQGAAYRPRTHHLEDGRPVYTNRLILETSPYLLQHAHNPVDWRPWGDEAFEEARRTGRPVFLSVGYATCHWCHVMEAESFEDERIAGLLNRWFVPIKVDREERPDVDTVYMTAVQALAGQGGWPMSVWLDADRQPFFGGTYFPPADRWGRPGFSTLLERIHALWEQDRAALLRQGAQLTEAVRSHLSGGTAPSGRPDARLLEAAARELVRQWDRTWGGFGGAPKFPRSETLRLLLRHHRRTGDSESLAAAVGTLDAMHRGGIYDHVGGGFARYSTDARWLVPHFEKMLYDNALLVVAYLEAHLATGERRFAEVAEDVLAYVAREMTSPEGAFYSATDADSEGEEGRFFVWTPDEIDAVLGAERGRMVRAFYGVTAEGNFEGRNVLHAFRSEEDTARELGLEPTRLREILTESRDLLREARALREPPLLDDKVLTGWNALMISAFAVAARVLDRPDYAARAARAADFLLANLRPEGRLLRSWRRGLARHDATLEDFAFLAAACLDLFEATFEPRWLDEAAGLQDALERLFRDPAGGYFSVAADARGLPARPKELYDGAMPSGNSVATLTGLRLHALTGEPRFREGAEAALAAAAGSMEAQPTIAPTMLCALDWALEGPWEVAIVHPPRESPRALLAAARAAWTPNAVHVVVPDGPAREALATRVPLVAQRPADGGRAVAYLCREGVCLTPTDDPSEVRRVLSARPSGGF